MINKSVYAAALALLLIAQAADADRHYIAEQSRVFHDWFFLPENRCAGSGASKFIEEVWEKKAFFIKNASRQVPDHDYFPKDHYEETRCLSRDIAAFGTVDIDKILETGVGKWAMTHIAAHAETLETILESPNIQGSHDLPHDVTFENVQREASTQEFEAARYTHREQKKYPLPGADWRKFADREKATMVIRDADGRHPALHRVADHFKRIFGFPVGISVYYTPPGAEGVPIHMDTMDVIAWAVAGEKKWELRDGRVHLPRGDMRYKVEPRHFQKKDPTPYTLRAGDALYVPRGVIHNTTCVSTKEACIHVSIGIESSERSTAEHFLQHSLKRRASLYGDSLGTHGCFKLWNLMGLVLRRLSDKNVALRQSLFFDPHNSEDYAKPTVSAINSILPLLDSFTLDDTALSPEYMFSNIDAWFVSDQCRASSSDVVTVVLQSRSRLANDVGEKTPIGMALKALKQMLLDISEADADTLVGELSNWWDQNIIAESQFMHGYGDWTTINTVQTTWEHVSSFVPSDEERKSLESMDRSPVGGSGAPTDEVADAATGGASEEEDEEEDF